MIASARRSSRVAAELVLRAHERGGLAEEASAPSYSMTTSWPGVAVSTLCCL